MSKFAGIDVTEQAKRRRKIREEENPVRGLRVIRPVVPVRVELHESQPVHVYFRGAKGEVTTISGPWRGSGDWWREEAWDQDEWDLAIDFGTVSREQEFRERRNEPFPERGVYRVFYDGLRRGWFVRGFYD